MGLKKWSKKDRAGKYVTYSETINHGGIEYPINVTKTSGVFLKSMRKLIEQIDIMLDYYKRITIVRVDLRQVGGYTDDNKPISTFMDAVTKKIKRKYKTKRVGYIWAREVATDKHLHYHIALIMDSKVVNTADGVLQVVNSLCRRDDSVMSIGYCKTSYFRVTDDDISEKLKAVYAVSYLCKERTKGYRGKQAKDYNTSRVKPKIIV